MRRLLIWREGARAYLAGSNFAMTPYGPPPNYTNATWAAPWKGRAWADGWWWAVKHRPLKKRNSIDLDRIEKPKVQRVAGPSKPDNTAGTYPSDRSNART